MRLSFIAALALGSAINAQAGEPAHVVVKCFSHETTRLSGRSNDVPAAELILISADGVYSANLITAGQDSTTFGNVNVPTLFGFNGNGPMLEASGISSDGSFSLVVGIQKWVGAAFGTLQINLGSQAREIDVACTPL